MPLAMIETEDSMTHDTTRPCGHDTNDSGRRLTADELRAAAACYGVTPVALENGLACDITRGDCPSCAYDTCREDVRIGARS